MKKITLLLALICSLGFAQTPSYKFTFDNTAVSAVGSATFTYNNNGGLPNAHFYVDNRNENELKALSLRNKTAIADGSALPIGNSERTIAFWFKNKDVASTQYIFNYGTPSNGAAFGLYVTENQIGFIGYGGPNFDGFANYTQVANTWTHYMITYNANNVNVYINNKLVLTKTCVLATAASSLGLGFGTGPIGSSCNFEIDDFQVYNSLLNDAEMFTVYRSDDNKTPMLAGVPTANLVYANFFTDSTSDSSPTGAVYETNNGSTKTVGSGNIPNTARDFNVNQSLVYRLESYGEDSSRLAFNDMRTIGILSNGFTVNLKIKIDQAYWNSLPNGKYVTFLTYAGIYMRILKGTANTAALQCGFQQQTGGFPQTTTNPTVNINIFDWTTITLTKNSASGANLVLYVNGVYKDIVASTSLTYYPTNFMTIGSTGVTNQSFKGQIDDLLIYNTALTSTQVSALNNTLLSNENFNTNNLKFNLYPNPATDILNISMETELKSVEIYSLLGQKVLSTDKNQVDVSSLSKGMYMVRVEDVEGSISTQKLIIK